MITADRIITAICLVTVDGNFVKHGAERVLRPWRRNNEPYQIGSMRTAPDADNVLERP
jgi:hypothetical protein